MSNGDPPGAFSDPPRSNFLVSEGMPPRKDFRQPRDAEGDCGTQAQPSLDRMTVLRDHPMKKMQAKSHDGHGISLGTRKDSMKLNRSNDLLAQSSTETLLDMLKAHAGIKECSEETEKHINGVRRRGGGKEGHDGDDSFIISPRPVITP